MNYISLSDYLKEKYNTKVYKLSLTSGCTCPNRDGTISYGGCIFCSEGGSGDFAAKADDIESQINQARALVDSKISSKIPPSERKYIAYFQSFTSTYGDEAYLQDLFSKVLARPEIVGLSIGTRPDCLSDSMIEFLSGLNQTKEVWVELGLQTIHESTATLINRGYPLPVFEDAYKRLTDAGLKVVVHLILGLPGETESMILDSVKYLANLSPTLFGIKLQLLHILRGTRLADMYASQPFHVFTLDEYCNLIGQCLQVLPAETVIHRLTGDGPKRLLIAPTWSANKKLVLNTMTRFLASLPD
ncbi:MAG: TIGR01212 family radical SAM protein [Pseudobutyrivibrio sp.]|nr:TIGR01212 family radical SAM protein [Pseudobutyrivibrio sp.]